MHWALCINIEISNVDISLLVTVLWVSFTTHLTSSTAFFLVGGKMVIDGVAVLVDSVLRTNYVHIIFEAVISLCS